MLGDAGLRYPSVIERPRGYITRPVNVITRGKNPFSATNPNDEGTVPYVRYQQDL